MDTAQRMAQACADAMARDDHATRHLGIAIEHIAPGEARLSFSVGETMINGHAICHGGYIFTLADTAFAYACNTYNQRTVAQHCAIEFLSPAFKGDRLTATARESARKGRSGIYDIEVSNQKGECIALFRGLSRTIKGALLSEEP